MAFTRQRIHERLRGRISAGQPIIGGGAGNGISAKCQEAGGVDLLVIYNSGRFRMNGRGSLAGCMPYGDANAIVMEMAGDVLPVVPGTPVLAGVCGTDPTRLMDRYLLQIRDAGFSGVQNFPTVGLIRRSVPRQPGGDRDGLCAGGGNGPPGTRSGPVHLALRLRRGRGGRHGEGGEPTWWSPTWA